MLSPSRTLRMIVLASLVALLSLGVFSTVHAAAPSITPASATVPFGQTSITLTWDTGDGSVGQVWVRYNATAEKLLAQNPSGSVAITFLVNSGDYTFTLYKGVYQSSPAAQGAPVLAQTIQHKVNPNGGIGAEIEVIRPNPDGSAPTPAGAVNGTRGNPGGYSSGGGGQELTPSCRPVSPTDPCGNLNPLLVDPNATYPRTVYVAFDAGSLPSGEPRSQVDVYVTAPNTPQPLLFTRNAIGIVPAPFIVDGAYTFTLYDSATQTPLTNGSNTVRASFDTASGVTSDKQSYTGGVNATVKVNANSDTGGPTLVCVRNTGTGAGPQYANNGTIVGYGNTGVVSVPLTGLGVNATPYTLMVFKVTFSSGPQFITSVTAGGQNCGSGQEYPTPGPLMAPALSNATGATATLTPAIPINFGAQFTINP